MHREVNRELPFKALDSSDPELIAVVSLVLHWFPMLTLRQAAVLLHPGKDQTTRPLRCEEICMILKLCPRDNIDSLVVRVGIQLGMAGALRGLEHSAPSNSFRVTEKRKLLYVRRDRIFLYDPKDSSSKHFALYWFFKSKKNQTYKREVAIM